jgi:hypothetical protein
VFLPRAPKLAARLQPFAAEEEAGDVFVEHSHKERNRRGGLGNDLIVPSAGSASRASVRREEQLGGVAILPQGRLTRPDFRTPRVRRVRRHRPGPSRRCDFTRYVATK